MRAGEFAVCATATGAGARVNELDQEVEPEQAHQGSWITLRLVLALGVLAACLNLYRFRFSFFTIDDSWISFRIARNWLEAGVLTYDLSRLPVEGMTNLLWTLLSAGWIAAWPDADPEIVARTLGVICYLASIVLLARIAYRESLNLGGNGMQAAAFTIGLCAVSTSLAYHSASGLETAFWGFLYVASLERYGLALRGDRRAALVAGVLLGLLAMTRPEGVAVGALLCGFMLLVSPHRNAIWAIAPFAILVGAMEWFRFTTYGEWVPNTFYAKPPTSTLGLPYARDFWVYALGIFGPIAMLPLWKRATPFLRAVACVAVFVLLGAVWSGGDWMPGFRRLTLGILSFYLLIGVGVSLSQAKLRTAAWIAVATVVMGNAAAVSQITWSLFNRDVFDQLGKIANQTPGVDEVALTDIGLFGWRFRGSIFDLAGLTDRHLAHLHSEQGKHVWDEAYFKSRSPDLVFVLCHYLTDDPIDKRFTIRAHDVQMVRSLIRGNDYRFHTKVHYLASTDILIFRRADLALPVELWGPPSRRDLLGELRTALAFDASTRTAMTSPGDLGPPR